MTDERDEKKEVGLLGADAVTILYILGGIPTIVAFVVLLFVITGLFPDSVPA